MNRPPTEKDSPLSFALPTETATRAIARQIADLLQPGDVLCLSGDLGAGKTTFTRYLTAALGSGALVSSPTFALIHEYTGGRLPVYHMDAYRLRSAQEADNVGLEEYLGRADGITVIEWPEHIAAVLPSERLEMVLTEEGDGRRAAFHPQGLRWQSLISELTALPRTAKEQC